MEEEMIVSFSALMNESCGKSFAEWGYRWLKKWEKDTFYLPPEAKNKPWIEFVEHMACSCEGQSWESEAKKLWNETYAPKLFPAKK